jgi:hypothetical protein
MNEYTTDNDLLYQARLQSLREEYETANHTSTKLHKGCSLSSNEVKDFIRSRVKEAKWAKRGTKTMNNLDPLTWLAIFLLSMAASSMIFLMYLLAGLG